MKKFKYYLAFFTLCALLMTGCSKDEPTGVDINDPSSEKLATLTIGASLNDILNLNRTHLIDDLPACSDDTPVLASIVLRPGDKDNTSNANDIILDIEIVAEDYNNDNVIDYFTVYEEALKLPAGTYTLRQFFVYSDEDKDMEDLIWIAPFDDGDGEGTLSEFVENPLPLEFNLFDGEKRYVDVEVLCYDQRDVNEYGFVFFDILPRKIYNFCFFANYCVGNRDYPANYSLELWYGTNIENPESNTPLVGPETNMVGYYNNDGEEVDGPTDRPFARPLCIPIPEPGPNDTGAYLTYRLTLEDWDGVYGSAAGTDPIVGTLSWAQILAVLDTNEDGEITDADTANIEYLHLFFNCGEIPDGGGNGCDQTDPEANCDNDDLLNKCDPSNPNFDGFDCDGDDIDNGAENDGCINNPDKTCGETGGPVVCNLSIPDPANTCFRGIVLDQTSSSYAEVGLDTGVPIVDANQPAIDAATFGITLTNAGIEYNWNSGSATVPQYLIEIKDTENGDVFCVDENDTNNTVEGNFSYPIYIRVSGNICPPA
ncbi:hypothetical protein [Gramella sp. MAR_2010_147]|uniref:hypothetical protein n=1 Tax=Gramella sp. MAR_2010_147 TaxID=1250205 RepID=UPI00087DCE7F|nr:hypothetical protein [Gramella sp. MAR_2010_147]SDR68828.1 hypothetical protein SAMN04488553_0291 [Gramella sp. MAR_2010_147]